MKSGWTAIARCALPGMIVATLLFAFTSNKAFTIDDTLFLLEAQHLRVDPLHPTALTVVWDETPQRLSAVLANGPLMGYLLVPAVIRDKEWPSHLIEWIFLLIAIAGTASLALRMGLSRYASTMAALVLVTMPAVLGMAATAMPDVPAMAFGVIAVERTLAWRANRRLRDAVLLSLALALAILSRPHLAMLLPVCGVALWEINSVKKRRAVDWLPLPGAALVAVLAFVITRDPSPAGSDLHTTILHLLASPYWIAHHAIAYLSYWVSCVPIALHVICARGRRLPWWIAFLTLTLCVAIHDPHAGTPDKSWVAYFMAGAGALTLVQLILSARQSKSPLRYTLVAWLFIALPVICYVHIAPKYLLASAPAAAILIAGLLPEPRALRTLAHGLVIAASLTLGILIVRTDAAYAGLGRRAAREVIPKVERYKKTIWFAGHWGFQWYAQRAGAVGLSKSPPYPQLGDFLIVSTHSDGAALADDTSVVPGKRWVAGLPAAELLAHGRIAGEGAGFYSDTKGFLPWVWTREEELDSFPMWEITKQ